MYQFTSLPRVIRALQKHTAVSGQCDCACAGVFSSNLNQPYLKSFHSKMLLSTHSELQFMPLSSSDDFDIAFVPSVSEVALVNSSTRTLLKEMQTPRPFGEVRTFCCEQFGKLGDSIVNTLISLNFLTDTTKSSIMNNANPLIAWIHVTNRCNLRCHYCYLRKTHESMTSEIGRSAIDAIFRCALIHDYSSVKLKYAGGEPLLNFSLVMELHKYALSLSNIYGIELDGVVLSNGTYLTEEIIRFMCGHDIRLMISLDGLGEINDLQRSHDNGKGSYRNIIDGIERAISLHLIPDISVTVTEWTIDGLPKLIEWLLVHDLPFNLNFYRENYITRSPSMRIREKHIIDVMQSVFKVLEKNLSPRSLLSSLIDHANLAIPHTRGCAVGHNYLVIDHRGNIAKCQMQINNPVTTIESYDPLSLIHTDTRGIQNLSVDEKEDCQECSWRYWCGGGCPLLIYHESGHYDLKSPNCSIYKTLFPGVIRLEGLRLLKYFADLDKRTHGNVTISN